MVRESEIMPPVRVDRRGGASWLVRAYLPCVLIAKGGWIVPWSLLRRSAHYFSAAWVGIRSPRLGEYAGTALTVA